MVSKVSVRERARSSGPSLPKNMVISASNIFDLPALLGPIKAQRGWRLEFDIQLFN